MQAMRRYESVAVSLTEEAKLYTPGIHTESALEVEWSDDGVTSIVYACRMTQDASLMHRASCYILHAHLSDPEGRATCLPFAHHNSIAQRMAISGLQSTGRV